MAESDKTYPLAFSALAFLRPKHLDPAQLFDEDDDDETLRRLKPAPETVRAAILACKEHGFRARYSGGIAISIDGDAAALERCFGVRSVLDDDPAAEEEFFETLLGERVDSAEPITAHPLAKHIASIEANPAPRLMLPRYPNTANDWDKQPGKPEHIWPHELRARFSVEDNIADKDRAFGRTEARWATSRFHGRPFHICLVDTGLHGSHEGFRWLDEAIQQPGEAAFPMQWPQVERLEAANGEMLRTLATSHAELRELLNAIDASRKAFHMARFMTPTPSGSMAFDDALVDDPRVDQLRRDVVLITASPFFDRYLSLPAAPNTPVGSRPGDLQRLLSAFKAAVGGAASTVLWTGNLANLQQHVPTLFASLRSYLQRRYDKLQRMLPSLEDHGAPDRDYDGHGTMMAASMLGIAGNATVVSFPALAHADFQALANVFGHPPPIADTVFDDAVAWAKRNAKRIVGTDPKAQPADFKTISNSYSLPLPWERRHTHAHVKHWKDKIRTLTDQGFVILFSAGNSGEPKKNEVGLHAMLGSAGAIIVGGAWDHDRTDPNNPDRYITLSDAAHGMVVKDSSFLRPAEIVPDICGFVGPQQQGVVHGKHTTISPYVYLPTVPSPDFHYYGGGTSSACAQVAAICGALRSRYWRLSPEQVKKALIAGGDPITHGKSYQGKSPKQLGDKVRLANLVGTFVEGARLAGKKWR